MLASLVPDMPYGIAIAAILIPIYVWRTFARTPKGRR